MLRRRVVAALLFTIVAAVQKDNAGALEPEKLSGNVPETPFDGVDPSTMSSADRQFFEHEKKKWLKEHPDIAKLIAAQKTDSEVEQETEYSTPDEAEVNFVKSGQKEGIPAEALAALWNTGELDQMADFADKLDEDSQETKIAKIGGGGSLGSDPPFLQMARNRRLWEFASHVKHGNYDVNKVDARGYSAAHYLMSMRNASTTEEVQGVAAMKILKSKKDLNYNVRNGDDETPLHVAMKGLGPISIVKEFVTPPETHEVPPKLQLNVGLLDRYGYTPLRVAVNNNYGAGVLLLLEIGGSPLDKQAKDGLTPFLAAIHHDRFDMVRPLVAYGSLLNHVDFENNNAFHLAMLRNPLLLPVLLDCLERSRTGRLEELRHSMSIMPNGEIKVPQDLIAPNVFENPIALPADDPINAQNNDGDTPLHLAIRQAGKVNIARLLRAGANLNLKNNRGLSSVDLAKFMGRDADLRKASALAQSTTSFITGMPLPLRQDTQS